MNSGAHKLKTVAAIEGATTSASHRKSMHRYCILGSPKPNFESIASRRLDLIRQCSSMGLSVAIVAMNEEAIIGRP